MKPWLSPWRYWCLVRGHDWHQPYTGTMRVCRRCDKVGFKVPYENQD